MDAYELGRTALKQANSTEGWGASLGGAAGGTMGGSIGGAIGKFTGGLADKAVSGAKSWAFGSGAKPTTPSLNVAGTSAMTKADPFSTTFGQLIGKATGSPIQAMSGLQASGNLRGGMNTRYGRPPSLDDLAGAQPQPQQFGGQFGGQMAAQPNFSFPSQAPAMDGAAVPKQPGFMSGLWGGVTGDQNEPTSIANTVGRLVGGEFDPLAPLRGGVSSALGQHAALAGAPMYGRGPWGMGVEYLANRFAPESVKRMAGAVGGYLPNGPGAVVNGYRAFVPAAGRAAISNAIGGTGNWLLSQGTTLANVGRTAAGLQPWAMPAARTSATAASMPAAANVLSRIPGFAGAAGRMGTGGLAGYGAYVAWQAPTDFYNVATGKVNLNERAATQRNQNAALNVGQNLVNPGEAFSEMGPVMAYSLGRSVYDYLAERNRGTQLDQQLAKVKARLAAKTTANPTPPAI